MHNHPDSVAVVKVAEVKQIKTDLIQTAASGGSTHQTLCNNLAQLSREKRGAFGNLQSVKCSFNRYIAQGRPDNPETLDDLIIQGIWANDVDGNLFLIHDNNKNNNNHCIWAQKLPSESFK